VSLFYRDAHSAIIVFDLSDIESINGVEFWINKLLEKVDPDEIIIKIIGNKSDSLD
jgi:GTPase SAR1 family protein